MAGNIHRDRVSDLYHNGTGQRCNPVMVSLIATIVTFVIVFFATPYVSQAVEKYTPLDDMIKQKVVSTMADAATSAITGGDTASGQGLMKPAVKKGFEGRRCQ